MSSTASADLSLSIAELLASVAERTRRYDFTVWFWGDAIAIDGLLEAADLLGDEASREHCLHFYRRWLQAPESWVDHLTPGLGLLRLYEQTGEAAFLERAVSLAKWLTEIVPHAAGGQPLYRPDLPPYRHTVWVDTIYHEPPFFARLAQLTSDERWFDEALAVWRSHASVLRVKGSPILGHSYDTGAGLLRGHGWGRGNGWAVLGLVDALEFVPADYPGREPVLADLVELCEVLVGLQDSTGFWRTLLDDSEAYLEASTAAFFGAAFRKGVRLGLLGERFLLAADRAWSATRSRILADGSFFGVSACTYASVHPDDDIQMYKTLPTEVNVWGQGAALRFAAERLRAGDGAVS